MINAKRRFRRVLDWRKKKGGTYSARGWGCKAQAEVVVVVSSWVTPVAQDSRNNAHCEKRACNENFHLVDFQRFCQRCRPRDTDGVVIETVRIAMNTTEVSRDSVSQKRCARNIFRGFPFFLPKNPVLLEVTKNCLRFPL